MMSLPGVDHRSVFFVWVLLQFLLRGTCVGFLGFVVTDKHLSAKPSTRYKLLETCCIMLWSLPLMLLVEGLWRLNHGFQTTALAVLPVSHTGAPSAAVIKDYSVLLLTIWASGTVLLLARLLVGLRRLRAMRRGATLHNLQGWIQKHSSLLDVHAEVYFAAVSAPLVFGHRQPCMLVPRHMDAMLEEDEIEALLLHELSHIHRRDYLRNMVQRIFVCLFWFHPFSWLLVSRLANARELCCDAEAVETCSPASLGRALLKLLENGNSQRVSTAGLSSLSEYLGERFAALLHEPGASSCGLRINPFQAGLTPSIFLLCALGAFWLLRPMQLSLLSMAQDSQMTVHAVDDAGPFELHVRNGRVLQARIDNEVLAGDLISQKGNAVSLLDHGGRARLVLMVDPSGRIAWTSRKRR